MVHKCTFIQGALLLMMVAVTFGHEKNCANSHNVGTLLKIDSRRNDSGHWISEVELVHSDKGERKGDPWTVDVHHRTRSCGEDSVGEVTVGATLVSPRLESFNIEDKPQKSYSHVGIVGLTYFLNMSVHFLYSNSTATWDVARKDCENLTCTLLQSEIKEIEGTRYTQDFLKTNGKIHVGYRRSNETPFDIEDLSGTKMNKFSFSSLGGNLLKTTENAACVSFDGTNLNAEPCDTRLHFMCVCHKDLLAAENGTTEEPNDYHEDSRDEYALATK